MIGGLRVMLNGYELLLAELKGFMYMTSELNAHCDGKY
jgi:hypothetical protein